MKCRVCGRKSYFLIDPCECGPVHAACLTSGRCEECSTDYLLPESYSWVPFAAGPLLAFVHGWLDHLDPFIPVIPRTLIIVFCQAVYVSLIRLSYIKRAVFLPALPILCMFVYVSVMVFYRDFFWYSLLQTYLFFLQGMLLYYHGPV